MASLKSRVNLTGKARTLLKKYEQRHKGRHAFDNFKEQSSQDASLAS